MLLSNYTVTEQSSPEEFRKGHPSWNTGTTYLLDQLSMKKRELRIERRGRIMALSIHCLWGELYVFGVYQQECEALATAVALDSVCPKRKNDGNHFGEISSS